MSVYRFARRMLVGEHDCRVIIEVADLGPDGWRRLTADPRVRWRRLPGARPSGGAQSWPRRRRARGRPEPVRRAEVALPTPALLEASGAATGSLSVAKQRFAARAMSALRAAGLHGELVGASAGAGAAPTATAVGSAPRAAAPAREPAPTGTAWPASHGVLIFGPADQRELDRRFEVASSVWALDPDRGRPPSVPDPAWRVRRRRVDMITGLCVLPLLVMAVPTVGPWFGWREWALLLAAASAGVALPVLVVQALARRWAVLAEVRARAIAAALGLLVLLLVARVLASLPASPTAVMVASALLLAAFAPVALRLLPVSVPAPAVLLGVPLALVVVAAPVGDLLDGVYLGRLGLRATDVTLTFAQRWWAGAFFGLTALAGAAIALALWGLVHQLDAVGQRRSAPPAPLVAMVGVIYAAAMLALAAATAWDQAGSIRDGLPGDWGGIAPTWVCWSAPTGPSVPFAGAALPPTEYPVAWLGGTPGRQALWSTETGGVTVSDQVQLRLREGPGRCH